MEALFPQILDLAFEIFLFVATIGIGYAINFFRKKTTAEQRKIIEDVIREGVLFAQQVYKHLDGPAKFDKAVEQIVIVLKEKGLKISEAELKLLLEATLKRLKAQFGEEW